MNSLFNLDPQVLIILDLCGIVWCLVDYAKKQGLFDLIFLGIFIWCLWNDMNTHYPHFLKG